MASAPGEAMRLDIFLWYARLAKTRGLAQDLSCTGRMRIDGRLIERAHAPVRIGNVLTYAQGGRVRTIRVCALPARRGPAPEAQACYTDLAAATDAGDANVSQQASA